MNMDFEKLYEFRFRNTIQGGRAAVWSVIAADLYDRMGRPDVVLDPAAGRGEFISAVPAKERWAIDQMASVCGLADFGIHVEVSNLFDVELPPGHFGGILLSNTLEHLSGFDDIQRCLKKMRAALQTDGVVAVLGPNFKYCAKEYFDCADHVIPLTHISVEEHLYAAGFDIKLVLPRYLPYSFRSWLPSSRALTSLYLRNPWAFRVLGKQFLVVASRTV